MAVSERERADLYARLREVLGEPDAETMIEMLPKGDPDDLATRGDVAGVAHQVDQLRVRMDRFEERMDGFDERMDRLEERMDRFEVHLERFEDRLHDFHGALREQTRNFILASTGSVITVGALAFAAARLV